MDRKGWTIAAALLWAWGSLCPCALAQSTGASENPWDSSTPARYIYLSPTGSDKNDGRTPLPQGTSGPKATLQAALNSASIGGTSTKTVLVLGGGRYDLSAPVIVPERFITTSALKIRSAEDQTAIITGAKAFYGSWTPDGLRPGVVRWSLASGLPVEYRNFHTLFSQKGEILVRARYPATDATLPYSITGGVPLLEFARSRFRLSDLQLEEFVLTNRSLPPVDALKNLYVQYLPNNVPTSATLLTEAASASGFTTEELVSGFTRESIGGTGPVTVPIKVEDCLRQTFVMDGVTAGVLQSQDPSTYEIVFLQTFESPRLHLHRLTRIGNTSNWIALLETPLRREFNGWLSQLGYRYYVEGSQDLLSEPGSWALDEASATLFYKLHSGESLSPDGKIREQSSQTPIYFNIPHSFTQSAPLLQIGKKDAYAKYVQLERVRFSYTDWKLPRAGYDGCQSYSCGLSGRPVFLFPAVSAFCEKCSLRSNQVSSVGGVGLSVTGQENQIQQNLLRNIGGNGIVLGNSEMRGESSPGSSESKVFPNRGNVVAHNRLQSIGDLHAEGTGIIGYQCSDTRIENNLVEDVSYSGISLGWDWLGTSSEVLASLKQNCQAIAELDLFAPVSFFQQNIAGRNNTISENLVRRAMSTLVDGAGIYLTGSQPGTRVERNFVFDINARLQLLDMMYGIYLDFGTQQVAISDNLIWNVGRGGILLNVNADISLRHNIIGSVSNGRKQGAQLVESLSRAPGAWVQENFKKACPAAVSISHDAFAVAHDNLIHNNLFFGDARTPLVLSSRASEAPITKSVTNGARNLFANSLSSWGESAAFAPRSNVSEFSGASSQNQFRSGTTPQGITIDALRGAVSVSPQSVGSSSPVSFGAFVIQTGPKLPVGVNGS